MGEDKINIGRILGSYIHLNPNILKCKYIVTETISLKMWNVASFLTLACIKWGLKTQRVCHNLRVAIKDTQSNATHMMGRWQWTWHATAS